MLRRSRHRGEALSRELSGVYGCPLAEYRQERLLDRPFQDIPASLPSEFDHCKPKDPQDLLRRCRPNPLPTSNN